ncbi:unnamed protein product [Gadus morhua 'NCC']
MEGTSESTTLDNMEGTSKSTTLDNMEVTPESTTLDNAMHYCQNKATVPVLQRFFQGEDTRPDFRLSREAI